MKPMTCFIIIACAGLLVSCASNPPQELRYAREAYQKASTGPAAQLVPAELHKAQEALNIAEKSFKDDPKSFRTRDLAYIADRKAKMAEALATTAAENANTAKANKDYAATQTEIVKNTKEDLAAAERNNALKTEQLGVEQKARLDAEARTTEQQVDATKEAQRVKTSNDANAQLAKVSSDVEAQRVKESTDAEARRIKELNDAEARRVKDLADAEALRLKNSIIVLEKGKKVVLRGVNFETNKATLTSESGTILTRAYNALIANPGVQIEISGHTDNVGSQKANQILSLKRAQAVRNWLVQKGIASNRMKAVGKGLNEPVASNETAEGRAENRRIEFYVQQ